MPKIQAMHHFIKNDSLFKKIVTMYQDAFKFNLEILNPLLIVYWAYRLSGRLGTLKFLDDSFVKRNCTKPLEFIRKMISQ